MTTERSDDRLKKELGVSRQSRVSQDRAATQNREVTDDERLEMFRMQLYNDMLPNLPPIVGYHVCWLTTTNKSDSIQQRLRLGYQLIRAEELPGMELVSQKTGEYAGCVAINEMVAAKLPLSLYYRYMQEAHHDAPNREEGKLRDTMEAIKDQANRDGGRVEVGDGMEELRENANRESIFA